MAKKRAGAFRASLLPKLLVLAVLLLLCFQLIRLNAQITDAKTQAAALDAQISALSEANQRLSDDIASAGDRDLVKDIARDQLGLVEPGEKVFYDVSN